MTLKHVYRIGDSGWQLCLGREVHEVPAWPRLRHPAVAVLDLDDIHTGVWRFDGKPEHAQALIEKRVRLEGLIEGQAHIVVHRLLRHPGGFQACFSAVPLEIWQRATAWAAEQPDHCLLVPGAGLLVHGVADGQGRALVSERRWQAYAQYEGGMAWVSVQGLGQGEAALDSAAQLMASQWRQALPLGVNPRVEVGALWAWATAGGDAAGVEGGVQALQTVLGQVNRLPTQVLAPVGEGGLVHTGLVALAQAAAGAQAVNPGLALLAWRAERWVGALAAVTVLAGAGLVGLGLYARHEAGVQRQAAGALKSEFEQLQRRVQAVSELKPPARLLPVTEFARKLDDGDRYDPIALLAVLRRVTVPQIRIQRVHLETGAGAKARAYRVDGVVGLDTSAAVPEWVAALASAGWSVRAVDPVETGPGAFSYELVAKATAVQP
jgi:Tfp pilus assembly protein PilN